METSDSTPFGQLQHFAGFDWASDHHDVAVVDARGRLVLRLTFDDSVEGWARLARELRPLGKVGVAIETSRGPEVERLMEMGLTVYPMNPKAAARYRERQAPSGVKDDALDAWSFADALRLDGRHWRPLRPEDPATQLLRLLCRDEITLIEQRTALVLQLKAALRHYFPAALEAFEDWTTTPAWKFLLQFPTPARLVGAGPRRWRSFLHTHRLWRPGTAEKRLEVFASADRFTSPCASVTAAKSLLAVSLARQLLTLQAQIEEYRRRIEQQYDQHPDAPIFKSLPAGGQKLAPRLLGEIGSDRQAFASAQALQCYAGSAPVTKQSGKKRRVCIRRMCNTTLRATLHLWVDQTRHQCAWAQAYYLRKKEDGMAHAQALRCLAQRWLKIIWMMWVNRSPYDEALHLRNMTRHGSWVLQHLPQPQPS